MFLGRILKTLDNRKTKSLLKDCSFFLKNGLYYTYRNSFFRIPGVLLFLFPPYLNLCRIHSSEKSKYVSLTKGKVCNGTIKIVILRNDKAYLLYKNGRLLSSKKGHLDLADSLFYPKTKVLEVNLLEHYVITSRVEGIKYLDNSQITYLFETLLRSDDILKTCEVDCLKISEGHNVPFLKYVQHGDCTPSNILFDKNGTDFYFIDLDNVALYPAFFDVFLYFGYLSPDIGIAQLKDNTAIRNSMEELLIKMGVFTNNYFDLYLSSFIRDYCIKRIYRNTKCYILRIINSLTLFVNETDYPLSSAEIRECQTKIQEYEKKQASA